MRLRAFKIVAPLDGLQSMPFDENQDAAVVSRRAVSTEAADRRYWLGFWGARNLRHRSVTRPGLKLSIAAFERVHAKRTGSHVLRTGGYRALPDHTVHWLDPLQRT